MNNSPCASWPGTPTGTPAQVAEKLRTYVDLGLGGVVPWCRDFPDDTSLRLFAEKVMPEFR